MKNIVLLTLAFSVFLFLSACNDDEFLDQKSPDQLNTENFWRGYDDALSGLTATYAELESRSDFWNGWQEGRPLIEYFRSDYVVPGPDAYNYSHFMQMTNFTYSSGHISLEVIWTTNYRGLNYANQVIGRVSEMDEEQITDEQKKQILGEATFLRAYYHFKLLSLYDQIVIRESEVDIENVDKPLSTRPEAWNVVLRDFKAAAEMLPWDVSQADLGRATKGAALAYLGKAYLYKAGDPSAAEGSDYQNAADALKQVIDRGKYGLETDFLSLFDGTNENNKESIFELQFKSQDANSDNSTALHNFINPVSLEGWGDMEASMGLVEAMKSEGKIAGDGRYDHRLYTTVFFKDPYFNDSGNPRMQGRTWNDLMEETYGSADAQDNHAYFRKWTPKDVWSSGEYTGINMVLMRYADVLLMYAEVLNELGQTAQAIPWINQVRKTHGNMPPISATSQDEVKKQIIHERTMEFSLESSRFFDLRRWGIMEDAMKKAGRSGFNKQKNAYLPVPLKEQQTNQEL